MAVDTAKVLAFPIRLSVGRTEQHTSDLLVKKPRSHLLEAIGDTPVVRVDLPNLPRVHIQAHLEFTNPTGSVKDRAAAFIIDRLLSTGRLKRGSRLIESSSGNFGIALAAYAHYRGLQFCCVIDPRINHANEAILRASHAELIKVTEPDGAGGFLKTRLARIQEILAQEPETYWINQYANPLNAEAYYTTLAEEMCAAAPRLDYVFLGVSSGGTIAGVSRRVKELRPEVQVIAVDSVGSAVFGDTPRPRFIPGIGSSIRPAILETAKIDKVIHIDEVTTVRTCRELYSEYGIFAGGSSGSVLAAMKSHFAANVPTEDVVVATIFADRGERYLDTIYNPSWYAKFVDSSFLQPPP